MAIYSEFKFFYWGGFKQGSDTSRITQLSKGGKCLTTWARAVCIKHQYSYFGH